MTKKADNNVLALPPMRSEFDVSTNTEIMPVTGRPIKQRERQIIDISQEQRTVMEHTSANARFGMAMVGKIHEQGTQTFEETTSFILDTKNQPGRDTEHQAYIDQFSMRQVQLLAQQTLGIIDVSATAIGMEVHRSLYPPEVVIDVEAKEVRPRGFLARLLGK